MIQTKGNAHAHVVLRGGSSGPNYAPEHIQACEAALAKLDLTQSIMVDCSHANSNKDHRQQSNVVDSVLEQIAAGNGSITGLMIESHLHAGNQGISDPDGLQYGVSITDACIDWEETDACCANWQQAWPTDRHKSPSFGPTGESERLRVVSILGDGVVGHILDRGQFRHAL